MTSPVFLLQPSRRDVWFVPGAFFSHGRNNLRLEFLSVSSMTHIYGQAKLVGLLP